MPLNLPGFCVRHLFYMFNKETMMDPPSFQEAMFIENSKPRGGFLKGGWVCMCYQRVYTSS